MYNVFADIAVSVTDFAVQISGCFIALMMM